MCHENKANEESKLLVPATQPSISAVTRGSLGAEDIFFLVFPASSVAGFGESRPGKSFVFSLPQFYHLAYPYTLVYVSRLACYIAVANNHFLHFFLLLLLLTRSNVTIRLL